MDYLDPLRTFCGLIVGDADKRFSALTNPVVVIE